MLLPCWRGSLDTTAAAAAAAFVLDVTPLLFFCLDGCHWGLKLDDTTDLRVE